MIEQFLQTGRFPADDSDVEIIGNGSAAEETANGAPKEEGKSKERGFIETEVEPRNRFEFLQMFVPWVALALVLNVAMKFWRMFKVLMFWR